MARSLWLIKSDSTLNDLAAFTGKYHPSSLKRWRKVHMLWSTFIYAWIGIGSHHGTRQAVFSVVWLGSPSACCTSLVFGDTFLPSDYTRRTVFLTWCPSEVPKLDGMNLSPRNPKWRRQRQCGFSLFLPSSSPAGSGERGQLLTWLNTARPTAVSLGELPKIAFAGYFSDGRQRQGVG